MSEMVTNTTVKVSEAAHEIERIVRRWQGVTIEIKVSPDRSGLAVITVQTPSGVEAPIDPGPSPEEVALDAAHAAQEDLQSKLEAMTRARDASDAEVERLREDQVRS